MARNNRLNWVVSVLRAIFQYNTGLFNRGRAFPIRVLEREAAIALLS